MPILKQITYTSEAAGTHHMTGGPSLVKAIAQSAQCKNSRLGITGVLAFHEGRFFQCLEGTSDSVDLLMEIIKRDTRHRNIHVMINAPIAERAYSLWSMADANTLIGRAANDSLERLFRKTL